MYGVRCVYLVPSQPRLRAATSIEPSMDMVIYLSAPLTRTGYLRQCLTTVSPERNPSSCPKGGSHRTLITSNQIKSLLLVIRTDPAQSCEFADRTSSMHYRTDSYIARPPISCLGQQLLDRSFQVECYAASTKHCDSI
jgi:hypothetical protein